ncbi:MAG: ParB/RepB/Spo0J family partition protein [Clostridia bacterium]|nr:ParB/RepB/Spo0J family partition protein [Clostridia bacterium]
MAVKRGGLGRGLDAIFAQNTGEESGTVNVRISEIEPNRNQPRQDFDPEALQELADSIAQHGMIQPVLVRPIFSGGYQLVAGERRWRAARMAGLTEIPVIIREMDDREFMELSLIENLMREDLSPIEEAMGFSQLMETYGLTQEEVANSVGKSRPAVANSLRLLGLPDEVREMVKEGMISAGHGRTLLALNDEQKIIELANMVHDRDMSVRELERLVKKMTEDPVEPAYRRPKNHYYEEVRLALGDHLGRKVNVSGTKKKGRIEIEFYGEEDLKNLMEMLSDVEEKRM